MATNPRLSTDSHLRSLVHDAEESIVCIGAAVYPEDGRTAQDILEIADRRLYQDKKAAALLSQTAVSQ